MKQMNNRTKTQTPVRTKYNAGFLQIHSTSNTSEYVRMCIQNVQVNYLWLVQFVNIEPLSFFFEAIDRNSNWVRKLKKNGKRICRYMHIFHIESAKNWPIFDKSLQLLAIPCKIEGRGETRESAYKSLSEWIAGTTWILFSFRSLTWANNGSPANSCNTN